MPPCRESDDLRSIHSWLETPTGERLLISVNLKAFDRRFFKHLLQALRVGDHAASKMRVGLNLETETPVLRFVPERAFDHVEQAGEEDLFRLHRHRSRFDLRQIENVGDQVQQVRSGAVNGARELNLLRRQIAVRVVAELLAEHQNAVQRRAQLVRHVGQELRFVLRSQSQFLGLFFQCATGLLDFLVLAFDFNVLFGQLLGFLRQLLVGLLQFFLLHLEFGGQLLRLLQQAFRLHRGLNTVEHDADAGRQLLEECQMRSREVAERGQFDHRLDAVFKQHGQHNHVPRNCFEQS